MKPFTISFTFEPHWTETDLIVECPSAAARDFIKGYLDKRDIILTVKDKTKRGIK